MKTLTVFTPTYNRAELLPRVYGSLKDQTSDDFVWLIVDDGSTDGTEALVSSFIAEGKVDIRYIKKENGGKHTAVNRALEEADTELIALSLDSDDVFTPDAVEKIVSCLKDARDTASGAVFLKGNSDGVPLYLVFDESLKLDSWQNAVLDGNFAGETFIVLKLSYARNFSFPVIEGEKFFTEAYVWLQMTEPLVWRRDVICLCDYLEDGYSNNITKVYASSPRSHMMYNDLRVKLWKKFLPRFKYAAYYDGFAMMCKEKGFIGRCSSSALSALALLPGFIFYLILKTKK